MISGKRKYWWHYKFFTPWQPFQRRRWKKKSKSFNGLFITLFDFYSFPYFFLTRTNFVSLYFCIFMMKFVFYLLTSDFIPFLLWSQLKTGIWVSASNELWQLSSQLQNPKVKEVQRVIGISIYELAADSKVHFEICIISIFS